LDHSEVPQVFEGGVVSRAQTPFGRGHQRAGPASDSLRPFPDDRRRPLLFSLLGARIRDGQLEPDRRPAGRGEDEPIRSASDSGTQAQGLAPLDEGEGKGASTEAQLNRALRSSRELKGGTQNPRSTHDDAEAAHPLTHLPREDPRPRGRGATTRAHGPWRRSGLASGSAEMPRAAIPLTTAAADEVPRKLS
jgi:hypothetical protein